MRISLEEKIGNLKFNELFYIQLIKEYGLKEVWNFLISQLKVLTTEEFSNRYVNFYDIGKLYEIGLAYTNKNNKKELGKYYTPRDVSNVMAKLLCEHLEENVKIADVGCGCGNLIIELLTEIYLEKGQYGLKNIKKIYLYDLDELALKISVARINNVFKNIPLKIKTINGDFLSDEIIMEKNIYVISNPPYQQIKSNQMNKSLPCFCESKDLYIGFIEKIINYSKCAVIISPQSYIVGRKFSLIREKINNVCSGEIFAFDNVPGAVFDGKKQGKFNTNTSNSVRAAISVFSQKKNFINGFRITHLIRFKSTQRKEVINLNYLKSVLGDKRQNLKKPLKCFRSLENFVYSIMDNNIKINDLLEKDIKKCNENFAINVSTSARYFTVGSKMELNRNGKYKVYAKNLDSFYMIYSLLNSSYCYLWWRMVDGGILYPKSVFLDTPIPKDVNIDNNLKKKIDNMINLEKKYLVYKKNAGINQESIKFPEELRIDLDNHLFKNVDFNMIHMNEEMI